MAATSETSVVCDAGPLIHLDEIAALDLLTDFSAVLVPDAVWLEIEHHRPAALHRADVNLSRIAVQVEPDPEFDALVHALILDAGEQAAIRLARQHPRAILLTDDAAARLAAEGLGLSVHGTLGLILRAARRNLRTPAQVLALLQSLPQHSSLFLRAQFLAGIIERFKYEYHL